MENLRNENPQNLILSPLTISSKMQISAIYFRKLRKLSGRRWAGGHRHTLLVASRLTLSLDILEN